MKSSSKSMPAKTPTVTPAKARGRPRTLQRDHVINVAMESYWVSGPSNVSVNDICKRANVSKPGLYREFGNEDGLQKEVLDTYCDTWLSALFDVLRIEQPFSASLQDVIALFLKGRGMFTQPRGCLLREMAMSQEQLGELTREAITARQHEALDRYAAWIDNAIKRGDITTQIPLDIAASYVDLQFGNAMTLIKREEPDEKVEGIMLLAFSVFE